VNNVVDFSRFFIQIRNGAYLNGQHEGDSIKIEQTVSQWLEIFIQLFKPYWVGEITRSKNIQSFQLRALAQGLQISVFRNCP
jgi:hypothetical protein